MEVPAENLPVMRQCLMLIQAGFEHFKRSGSIVLATGIQEADIPSLVGVEIVSRGMG